MIGKMGVLVGPTRYGDPATRRTLHCLDLLDLDRGDDEPERIPLDFFAHGFALDPVTRTRAALLEKRGPGGALVDLAQRRVLAPIAPMDGHHFYGHGAYAKDGSVLFAIESELATKGGAISVRDPRTLAPIATFPTYGSSPHDCHLIEDGATLAITNGGGPIDGDDLGCVTFVDVATQKLLERLPMRDVRRNTGHLALTGARELAVVSAPRDGLSADTCTGGVALRRRGGELVPMTEPAEVTTRLLGESLSVCIDPSTRIALATHPYGGLVTFWSLDRQALLGTLVLESPRGVTLTLDGRYFAVAFGTAASLLLIKTAPLEPLTDRPLGTRRFGGSHVYTWERA